MFTLERQNVAGHRPADERRPAAVLDDVRERGRHRGHRGRSVEAHGGTIVVPPMEVMTAGKMAVFVDSRRRAGLGAGSPSSTSAPSW